MNAGLDLMLILSRHFLKNFAKEIDALGFYLRIYGNYNVIIARVCHFVGTVVHIFSFLNTLDHSSMKSRNVIGQLATLLVF